MNLDALSVIDNLTSLGQINSRRVRKRDQFFFFHQNLNLTKNYIYKEIHESLL